MPTSCLTTCLLPHVIRQFTQDVGLSAPLDLNTLNGGPNVTSALYQWTKSDENALASPSHPTCAGHERIAKHIVQQIFPEMQPHMKEVLFPMAHARPSHENLTAVHNGRSKKEYSAGEESPEDLVLSQEWSHVSTGVRSKLGEPSEGARQKKGGDHSQPSSKELY